MTEADFWGDCCNTYHEESKQLIYAGRMGLYASTNCAHPPTFDIGGRSIIDIGGGPVSLLLKCVNRGKCQVIDPIFSELPAWVPHRYFLADIEVVTAKAEGISHTPGPIWDEAWIYNCLQHVDDPELVVRNALAVAKTLRIFEWIDIEAYEGHPHRLERDKLDEWLGSPGFVATVNDAGAVGKAYYGVFTTQPVP